MQARKRLQPAARLGWGFVTKARCAQRFQGGGLLLGEMEELEPGRFQRFVTFDDPDACWQNFAIPDVGTLGNAVEGNGVRKFVLHHEPLEHVGGDCEQMMSF